MYASLKVWEKLSEKHSIATENKNLFESFPLSIFKN